MLHTRRWAVAQAKDRDRLAEILTQHTWTLCSAFELGGYVFLNDSTSADGAQEYAVLKRLTDGSYRQIETITFGWCDLAKGRAHVEAVLAGRYDTGGMHLVVQPNLEPVEGHKCYHCA